MMPMCQVIRFSDDLPIDWRNFAWYTVIKMIDAPGMRGRDKVADDLPSSS
ncbi:hypothetical protein ABIA88_001414 [Bradyrhizobium sp. LA6.4]